MSAPGTKRVLMIKRVIQKPSVTSGTLLVVLSTNGVMLSTACYLFPN